MGIQFIPNIVLYLDNYETEIDIATNGSIRECLRYSKLICPSDIHAYLKKYYDDLHMMYIEEKFVDFLN